MDLKSRKVQRLQSIKDTNYSDIYIMMRKLIISFRQIANLLFLITMVISFSVCCTDEEGQGQNEKSPYSMLAGDKDVVKWYYTYYTRQQMELFCTIFYTEGLDTIHGKVYHKVLMEVDEIEPNASSEHQLLEKFLQAGNGLHVFDVREEEGRVFALKSMYVSFLHSFYQIENPFFVPASDEQEVLLYDFNLQEGQLYPCLKDVTVESIQLDPCYDGIQRKVFILSNGMRIMEGVGCTNSLGGSFAYQNANLLQNDASLKAILATYAVNEQWFYKVILNDDFTPI